MAVPLRRFTRAALRLIWRARVRLLPGVTLDPNARVGAVILSYKRQGNIDPIVRSLLKCKFVDRVIVSNNNPELRAADFVSTIDDRLQLIDQPERKRPGIRWKIATEELSDCQFVICIDDDVFLYPGQIRRLTSKAREQPRAVHGFAGVVDGHYMQRLDREVDYVERAYVVAFETVRRYFRLINEMGVHGGEVEHIGDDIVLSLAGEERARIDNVGFVLSCSTSLQTDIAVNQEPGFLAMRKKIYAEALACRTTV